MNLFSPTSCAALSGESDPSAVRRPLSPYAPLAPNSPIDLFLDANEGPGGCVDVTEIAARLDPDGARRYSNPAALEDILAARFGVCASRVLVTAGGDEAIDRVCRTFLRAQRDLILPVPTFEMIARYAALAGARVLRPEWSAGRYPIEAVLNLGGPHTAMVAVVSPNNPTGAVATPGDLQRLSAAFRGAILLVDLAYAEFADEDLTAAALELPNAVVTRTFSKAFGLAGLRVGYALGPEPLIREMRSGASPYPCSSLSLAAAASAVRRAEEYLPPLVTRIRKERTQLVELLRDLGAKPQQSQGNFVLADFADAEWAWQALGGLGIAVRRFHKGIGLDHALRISCPGHEKGFERLSTALRAALRPEALLFDMDGVLADVSGSYRRAITLTSASFGVPLAPTDVSTAKAEGNANNDWVLTQRLLERRGVRVSLDAVKSRFESLYHGAPESPGLIEAERLIPDRSLLERLAGRLPLGIVTGRPRRDCDAFLARFNLTGLFRAIVCMEDAPAKPDSAPVRLALEQLGVMSAWLVGDTPDDIVAARAAGVVPLAIVPPGDNPTRLEPVFARAGAARTLLSLSAIEELLP